MIVNNSLAKIGNLIETVYGIGYRLKLIEESTKGQHQEGVSLTTNSSNSNSQANSQSKSQQTISAINLIWQKHKARIFEQVNVLEQAAIAATQNDLNRELHSQAEREAHTLAGSLGTFGYPEGSKVARQIEKLLKAERNLEKSDPKKLYNLRYRKSDRASSTPLVVSQDLFCDQRTRNPP